MEPATPSVAFPTRPLPVEATFDIDQLTSDGGLLWLAEADDELELSAAFAAHLVDWRQGPVCHSLPTLVRQRMLQIAAGYPDQNDATRLRHDPILKLSCDRRPASGLPLASQPTLSRLDNAVDEAACARLAEALLALYLDQRAASGVPRRILLDVDSTDDPTHGNQERSRYHGYYRQHMYHPLLLFDGETDQLISARLRPGNAHASWEVLPELERIVAAIRLRWPHVRLELRSDAGGATPALYDWCEQAEMRYTIGLIPNARLERLAAALLAAAEARYARTGQKVRLIGEIRYQADSWAEPRRVIVKAEVMEQGTNTRFVVTNRTESARTIYASYLQRGETENWIKDFKRACQAGCPLGPLELFALLGQSVPPAPACCGLLVARHGAALAQPPRGGAHATGQLTVAADQDRWLGAGADPSGAAAPGQQSSRTTALALTCHPTRPLMNNPG